MLSTERELGERPDWAGRKIKFSFDQVAFEIAHGGQPQFRMQQASDQKGALKTSDNWCKPRNRNRQNLRKRLHLGGEKIEETNN